MIDNATLEFHLRGFDRFMFDVRNQLDYFEESFQLIADNLLPKVRVPASNDAIEAAP